MTLSRKHYISVAASLRSTSASVETAVEMANRFREDSVRFDFNRFMVAACGPDWNADGRWVARGGFSGPEYLTRRDA